MKGEPTQVLVQRLCAGDEREGYAALKELLARSRAGRDVYSHWEELAALLTSPSSYRRTRGALLLLQNARWAAPEVLARWTPQLLALLQEEVRATALRQYLRAWEGAVGDVPALAVPFCRALEGLDLDRYGESMAPLLRRDRARLLRALQGGGGRNG
ncbi:hypothetical protein [Bittarella massiliensis (ex Durand et al. 2017)]|uniref:hypothetical protein n=1 Tax=Bittarella massiliensis (ex Durand et al. 2017) TaxID=1720313 RepID=UPI001AA16164|nr:hypothetical protein [Bittarella massiliensis (ex Durand et al. 2017)]MBO1679629.1 hypothetical protein [Bittarella massiliensis (ex Durand et al. 2017)]